MHMVKVTIANDFSKNDTGLIKYTEVVYDNKDYVVLYDKLWSKEIGVYNNSFNFLVSELPHVDLVNDEVDYIIAMPVYDLDIFSSPSHVKDGKLIYSQLPLRNNEIPEYIKVKISKKML